ncbi:hypothetical protein KY332_03620 [Candidatus Woesearchaeota archaeon]|nr:hypothetical protein [Candidatus Woesearchaeota archaeon]
MKLSAEIKVWGEPKELKACFEPELADKKRSNFKIKEGDGCLIFQIEADDSVALRATMNGITKLITVYEKVNKNG